MRIRVCHLMIVAIVAGLAWTVPAQAEGSSDAKVEVPEGGMLALGNPIPAFPTGGTWFGGDPLTVEDLKGKVTILYFLTPGCPSCDEFSPHLLRLMLRHPDDLQVVGITFAGERHAQTYARDAIARHPVYHDPGREYTNRLIGRINIFPYVAILDRDARMQWFGRAKFHAHVTRELERVLDPDTAAAPEAALPVPAKQYALVIGRSTAHRGTSLPAPARDAADLAALLTPHFEEVVLLTDARGQPATSQPTPGNIRDTLNRLAETAGKEGAVLIYYAGDANLVLLQGRERVDLMLALDGPTMMINHFSAILNRHGVANRLMLIDVNQGGRVFDNIEDALNAGVPDMPVLFSAARHDHAYVVQCPEGRATSLFSFLLRRELGRGAVSPEMLFRRIRDGMSAWSRHDGRMQSPMQIRRDSEYAAFRIRASDDPAPDPAADSSDEPDAPDDSNDPGDASTATPDTSDEDADVEDVSPVDDGGDAKGAGDGEALEDAAADPDAPAVVDAVVE